MFTLNCKGRLLVVDKPLLMGILNITPDSFYTGSRYQDVETVLHRAAEMLAEGASILDIGGQSTRPGSERLGAEEEWNRVEKPLIAIRRAFPEAFISIDTFYGSVAEKAVLAGADIVNDISAGTLDNTLLPVVARLQVPYVLMHMKGNPQTMQQEAVYSDVTAEVLDYFLELKDRLHVAGIKDIIIDPGFGFAKNIQQNFIVLRQLEVFKILRAPLLLGISRKSFIWKTLGSEPASADTLAGTTALHMAGLLNGASILRVHDVKEAAACIRVFSAMHT